MEEFYDVIINIKSIYSLSKEEGWPIKWNNKRKDIILKNQDKKLLKVGVLGNGNVGKSFLLSRLFGVEIPSGFSVTTEGLSLKYNIEDRYIILDSAGLQTPLLTDENLFDDKDEENKKKKYESLYKDKTQTENFIQNLIIDISDMILIVVGKLTFNEQRLINKIKKVLESSNQKNKIIYVIHNLINFQTKEQVEEHIKINLLKSASFNLKYIPNIITSTNNSQKSYKGREILVEEEKISNIKSFHLIMARENTEAGDYYNNFTYTLLNDQFNFFTDRNPLSIIDEIKNKFVSWSGEILEEKISEENIEIVNAENSNEEKIIFKKSENSNLEIIPKSCISDELGLNIYRSNGFDPNYYYYIENDEYLVIVLEVPGDVKIEDKYADIDKHEIIVLGKKEDHLTSKKVIDNNTKFGNFKKYIKYKDHIMLAEEEAVSGQETQENGILEFKFRLAKRRRGGPSRDNKK